VEDSSLHESIVLKPRRIDGGITSTLGDRQVR
jgi:hypothetical protein